MAGSMVMVVVLTVVMTVCVPLCTCIFPPPTSSPTPESSHPMEPKTKSLTIPEPDSFKTKELIVKYGGVETETIIWVYEYKR